MEVYCTKKIESADGFAFDVPETLPYIHIITPEVVVKCDLQNNFYISDCPSDPSFITNIIKLKKIIGKSFVKKNIDKVAGRRFIQKSSEDVEKDVFKPQNDVIWIKPSPTMVYKKNNEHAFVNKMLTDHPISLQLSCSSSAFDYIDKPYNLYNVVFTCDYVRVPQDFDWRILSNQ